MIDVIIKPRFFAKQKNRRGTTTMKETSVSFYCWMW